MHHRVRGWIPPPPTLVALHPEYYYRKPDGSRGNKVGDWTDVVDLDYAVPGLWDYQIESLCYWAQYVDGFRCGVASTVPVAFWRKARQAVGAGAPPGPSGWGRASTWTTSWRFRRQGLYAATDNELFDVFDILYPYDIWPCMRSHRRDHAPEPVFCRPELSGAELPHLVQ